LRDIILMIHYPAQYQPGSSGVYVSNKLNITAPPETVWAWLIRADLWSTWYPNSSNMSIEGGTRSTLERGTQFRWKTFGVTVNSTVQEFVPYERIAWDAHATGIHAYHAWLIEETNNGCHVLTEETQNGWLARLGKQLMPDRMHRFHQIWLEQLQVKAAGEMPPEKNLESN
jgi:uncharacterized protein YndB with AHSA1/START domain